MPETTSTVVLRDVHDADLHAFFEHLRDPQAAAMASFTAGDPDDRQSFDAYWRRLRRNPDTVVRTIALADDPEHEVVGHILAFEEEGRTEVAYWIDRAHWGKGFATAALRAFLEEVTGRPLWARVARSNPGGQAVLTRNGFGVVGQDVGYSHERGRTIDEVIFRLG